jgi:class 3 adenylate cyclase/tetratricopeptide (TPR) repeat protein
MNCPNCKTKNPEGAKFCFNCGETLTISCANCGTQLPMDAKFCFNCGHAVAQSEALIASQDVQESQLRQNMSREFAAKLEAARSARSMEGERRIVTILFCDVSGSTSLAERLDPEEWTAIMNEAFQYLTKAVFKYEGTVARLMGDAILAFFGAPISHEDDPRRAILAGLEIIENIGPFQKDIQQRFGLKFEVRVGINTGLVVVGQVGSDLMVEYTAMGDTVNLASRMEQTARPGTVQIAADTYKLVSGLFDFEPLGPIKVKGRSKAVAAYRVLREKPGAKPMRGISGLSSPLVGRDEQMVVLRSRYADLLQGKGQIISLIGEAGLGKSRMLAEFHDEILEREGEEWEIQQVFHPLWLEGRSFSYETTTPFAPFIDVFEDLFNLEAEQTDEEKTSLIQSRLSELDASLAEEVWPYMATLLGVGLSGEDRDRVQYLQPPILRNRIFQSTFQIIENISMRKPVILALDDLHWADQTSLDLLQHLLSLSDRTMLMVITLLRPNRQDPSWQFHEKISKDYPHRYTAIHLGPLAENEARQLVANLLHIEDLPEKVRSLIMKKAEGNPFFAEEVIRSLMDARLVVRENSHWRATREVENISVPDTLVGVIAARLDQLSASSKQVIQTAAVIGREFPQDVLAEVHEEQAMLDEALVDLQRREVLREKSRFPQQIFSFKHVLTQETAYSSLLLSRRRELHKRVAEYLERNYPQQVNEIARHFFDARLEARSLPYLVMAGERAAQSYSTSEAIQYFQQALEHIALSEDPDLPRRAYEGLGKALALANRVAEAVDNYQDMYRFAGERQDIPAQISALNKLSEVVAMRLGQFPEAEKTLLDAERLARQHSDHAGLAETFMVRCFLCTATGDFDGAVNYLNQSVQIGRDIGQKEQMAYGLAHIAGTMTFMTRFDEAWKTAQEGLKIAEEIGNKELQAELHSYSLAMVKLCKGDLVTSRQLAETGIAIANKIGEAYSEGMGCYLIGSIELMQGNYEKALAWQQRSLKAGEEAEYAFIEAMALCALGTVYLQISEKLLDRTRELHQRAEEKLSMPGGIMGGANSWVDLGTCYLRIGAIDKARHYFDLGLREPTPTSLLQKPKFLMGLAEIDLINGLFVEAGERIHQARQFVEERAMRDLYPSIELASGQLAKAAGELELALHHFTVCQEIGGEMQMKPIIGQACLESADLLAKLGRDGEAATAQAKASKLMQEMADAFSDENLRAFFLEKLSNQTGEPGE